MRVAPARIALCLAVSIAATVPAEPAAACSCRERFPQYVVMPSSEEALALSGRLWVFWPVEWSDDVRFVLRDERGRRVPTRQQNHRNEFTAGAVLHARRGLRPGSRYSLEAIDRKDRKRRRVLQSFVTGAVEDRAPPTPPEVLFGSVGYHADTGLCDAGTRTGKILVNLDADTYAVGVWDNTSDPERDPPVVRVFPWGPGPHPLFEIDLGHPTVCDDGPNFSVPPEGTMDVQLVAIDAAGNRSPPVAVHLEARD